MIEIQTGKLYSLGCVVEVLGDESVRMVKMRESKTSGQELVEVKKSYGYAREEREYTLRVNLPPKPKLECVILLSHTSPNSWRIICSDLAGVSVSTRNTLTEVNVLLRDLLGQVNVFSLEQSKTHSCE